MHGGPSIIKDTYLCLSVFPLGTWGLWGASGPGSVSVVVECVLEGYLKKQLSAMNNNARVNIN